MGLDSAVRKNEFAELTAEDVENLPYAEAVEYLKKRDVIKKVDYNKLSDKMRFRAFTASRIADGDLLKRINSELIKNVNDGKGLKDFLSLTKTDILNKVGMGAGGQGWYWETVYRTNVQTAYNTGRMMGFEEDKPLALHFVGIEDSKQTDVCHSLSNVIRPYDDPLWEKYIPPLHFGCRSTVRAIYDEDELPDEWSSLEGIEKPAKGFGTNPLENDSWWNELSSQVARAKEYGVQGEIEAAKVALGVDGVYGAETKSIKHKTLKETKKIGEVVKEDVMTFEEADGQKCNPFFSLEKKFEDNCQACIAAFEARIKGFRVRAKGYDENNIHFTRLAMNPTRAFIDPSTRHHPDWLETKTFADWKDCLLFVKETINRGERYAMRFNWKEKKEGHIISVFRTKKGKLIFYDPQTGAIFDKEDYDELLKQISFDNKYHQPQFFRIDNLQFDENVLQSVLEASDE